MKYYVYESLGNRFILTETMIPRWKIKKLIIKEKADGFLLYKTNPLEMVIINKDGTKASMCGNGLKCFLLHGLNNNLDLGNHRVKVNNKNYQTNIGSKNPFYCSIIISSKYSFAFKTNVIFFKGKIIKVYSIMLGTLSHIVIDDNSFNKDEIIKGIKTFFKEKKTGNINFVKILSHSEIYVQTFERGVGYTLSWCTGSAASFYVLHKLNYLNDKVIINNPGGKMNMSCTKNNVTILGSASLIKEGEF